MPPELERELFYQEVNTFDSLYGRILSPEEVSRYSGRIYEEIGREQMIP